MNYLYILKKTDVCNFADENTLYSCGHSVEEVVAALQHDIAVVLKWFESNHLSS